MDSIMFIDIVEYAALMARDEDNALGRGFALAPPLPPSGASRE